MKASRLSKSFKRSGVNQRGFTLIELLVVVSIIALLVSILLPALSQARDQAKRAICATRCNQMAKAFVMYAVDNNDRVPPPVGNYPYVTGIDKFDSDIRLGLVLLLPYIGGSEEEIIEGIGKSWELFRCPVTRDSAGITDQDYDVYPTMLLKHVNYIQYCGYDDGNHPGAHSIYSRIEPGTVIFSDNVGSAYGSDTLRWANHNMSSGGKFIGANAARVDGSADWVSANGNSDLGGFHAIDGLEWRYYFPKPVGVH